MTVLYTHNQAQHGDFTLSMLDVAQLSRTCRACLLACQENRQSKCHSGRPSHLDAVYMQLIRMDIPCRVQCSFVPHKRLRMRCAPTDLQCSKHALGQTEAGQRIHVLID